MITTTIAHAEKVCVERAELESAAADFDGLKKDLNKCIDEADKIKSQRDQCSGKLDAQDVRIRTLEIEKMELITNVSLLKSDASSRWSWYIWLTIGAIIPPAAYAPNVDSMYAACPRAFSIPSDTSLIGTK